MLRTITTITAILLTACSIGQTNYYVSPTGDNSNSGNSSNQWLTIQYGLDQLTSGDTLNIETGTYSEKILMPNSGIYLRNKAGHSPIIDATGLTTQVSIIEIYDVSDITIDGIELQNNIMLDAQGIVVENNCQNITIKNCIIHDIHFSSNVSAPVNSSTNAQGIIVYGSDGGNAITNLKINNNELYDCRLGYSEGIAVNGNVDGFEVVGNLVHDITNIGLDFIGFEGTSSNPANDQARNGLVKKNTAYNCISPYATSGGIYIDGGKLIIVENNTSYHNGYGVEIGCENVGKTTEDIIVRNNIFYDNEVAALALGGFDYPSGSGKVINSTFSNNTCYYNDFSNQSVGEMYLSFTENCTIENNIFYTTNQNVVMYQDGTPQNLNLNYNIYFSDATLSSLTFDFAGNSYSGLASFSSATSHDGNSSATNPDLINAAIVSPDFHLNALSVAIDAGNPTFTAAAGELDIDDQARVNSGRVDCGADEYHAAVGLITNPKIQFSIYPNPTLGIVFVEATNIQEIEVTNSNGQLINGVIKDSDIIDLSAQSKGVYFVKIVTNEGSVVEKLIVK